MNTLTFVGQATGNEPAGGAALGEAIGATAAAAVATALIAVLIAGHRSGRITWLARAGPRLRAGERIAGVGGAAVAAAERVAADRGARDVLGHLAPHRQRARPGSACKPGPLPDPDRALRSAAVRSADGGARRRATRPDGRARRRGLVGAGRRRGDRGLRRLRAVGLPARRHVAPPVRTGRDALGPDPPDADRRRLARDARLAGAALRGGRDARLRPGSRPPRAGWCSSGGRCCSAASWLRCRPSRASSTSACRSSGRCCTRC